MPKLDEYEDLLTKNEIYLRANPGRWEDLRRAMRSRLACVGPIARAAGVNYDVRKAFPYLGYETYDFSVPVADRR